MSCSTPELQRLMTFRGACRSYFAQTKSALEVGGVLPFPGRRTSENANPLPPISRPVPRLIPATRSSGCGPRPPRARGRSLPAFTGSISGRARGRAPRGRASPLPAAAGPPRPPRGPRGRSPRGPRGPAGRASPLPAAAGNGHDHEVEHEVGHEVEHHEHEDSGSRCTSTTRCRSIHAGAGVLFPTLSISWALDWGSFNPSIDGLSVPPCPP